MTEFGGLGIGCRLCFIISVTMSEGEMVQARYGVEADCSWWMRPDDAENRVVYPIEALVIVHPRVGWGRSLKLTFKRCHQVSETLA